MNANDYQALAMRTSNKALTNKEHLINGALGMICALLEAVAGFIQHEAMMKTKNVYFRE